MIINFYPLTAAEQVIFETLNVGRTSNILILTQPDNQVGVDADALQAPAHVDYFNAITFDAGKIVVLDLDAIELLRSAKGLKEREINSWHEAVLDVGFDTTLGFFLSFVEPDRLDFTSRTVFLNRSVGRGSKQSGNTITVLDKDKEPRVFTIADLIETTTSYGEEYESIFETNIGLTAALKAAQTIADVDAIQVPTL